MTKMDSVTGSRNLQRYSLIQDFWQIFALISKYITTNDGRLLMVGFRAIDVFYINDRSSKRSILI